MGAVGMVFSYTLPTVAAEELEVILQPELSQIETPEHLLLEQPLTLQTLSSNQQEPNPTSTSEPSFSQLAQRNLIPNPQFDQPGAIIQDIDFKEAPPIQTQNSTGIQVVDIRVTGSTIFDETEFNPIIQPLEGKTATIAELRNVAGSISQLYLDQGFITSKAVIVEESLSTEIVEIRVIEGRLEEIKVEGTRRLDESYVRSRVQLGAGTPLNTGALEDQLRLLRVNPLFDNVEARLRAGTSLGESILVVRVTEANPFGRSFFVDNYSPPPVGSEALGVSFNYGNLTGMGDVIAGSYKRTTTGGAENFRFGYKIPVNSMNGTLNLRTRFERNEFIQEPFEDKTIQGESQQYEISYRQPLIRNPREEFALSLGFSFQDGQTFTFANPTPFSIGTDEDGSSRTSIFGFGQDYTRRDTSGAWSFYSQFSLGTGLFDATVNDNPIPDSRFLSWFGQVQRVQSLNPNNFLIIEADLQLTTDSLLPSEQFVIDDVRGYRQNVRAGDNGFRLSIEDRITLKRDEAGIATFVLAPFINAGYVWNVNDNPNNLPEQRFIAGMGLGILWEPLPNWNVRLDYAVPLVDIDDRRVNAQDEGFFFSISYSMGNGFGVGGGRKSGLPIPTQVANADLAITTIEGVLADAFSGSLEPQLSVNNPADAPRIIEQIEQPTGVKLALIYATFVDGRLELRMVSAQDNKIVHLPDLTQENIVQTATKLRREITNPIKRRTTSYLKPAQQLYEWLIAPLEAELDAQGIQNLVFIMDSGLRSLPIAALHDGQDFLVEKYSVGLMPSLSLTDTRYTNIQDAPVLAMGIAESSNLAKELNLSPLPLVPIELQTILDIRQGESFLNEAVTLENLKLQSQTASIVHLATHGEFKSGLSENSYILLWNDLLRLDQLRELGWQNRRSPIELLVLTATRTSLGDQKAKLGFAGLAVQAGVKSVLSSLWYISDEGTLGLMTEFYRQLETAPIKAEALRQAQLAMIRGDVRIEDGQLRGSGQPVPLPPTLANQGYKSFTHPYYWAGFTMIGSPW
jgi:hemolysin activation/secretion protein/CHAT domain-containing protein